MPKKTSVLILFIMLSVLVVARNDSLTLSGLLPPKVSANGQWQKAKEFEYYKGDDLFFLINGGAELYFEYGFNDVVSVNYLNQDSSQIKVELFRMENQNGAYGIFSFKRPVPYHFDEEIVIADGYSMFIKRDIYGLITNIDMLSLDTLKDFTDEIIAALPGNPAIPPFIDKLKTITDTSTKVVYMQGNIALGNFYIFDFKDIFGFDDGVYIENGKEKVYIFRYTDNQAALNALVNARKTFESKSKFTVLSQDKNKLILQDKRENYFSGETVDRYIILIQAQNPEKRTKSIQNISKILIAN